VSADLYPEVLGGVGLHAHLLSRDEARAGHDVVVITGKSPGDTPGVSRTKEGYRIVRVSSPITIFGNRLSLELFPTLVRWLEAADVVHLHSHLFFFSNVGSIVSRLAGRKTLLTIHGLVSQSAPSWVQSVFMETIGLLTIKTVSRIVCLSAHDMEELVRMGINRGRLIVIPEGVDCSFFQPSETRGDTRGGSVVLLSVGRLVPGKGFENLLRGFALALKEIPRMTLTIRGDGPLLPSLRKLAATLNVEDAVTFRGRVGMSELVGLYQNADVFVLTSFAEGVPKSILEAMACGLPVICSNLPQFEDLVADCGVSVDPSDAKSISRGIVELAKSPERRAELRLKCRDRVAAGYDWNEVSRRNTAVLEELAALPGGGS